jgi:hypothetical protein
VGAGRRGVNLDAPWGRCGHRCADPGLSGLVGDYLMDVGALPGC